MAESSEVILSKLWLFARLYVELILIDQETGTFNFIQNLRIFKEKFFRKSKESK